MDVAQLISAKLEGTPFERILHAVRTNRDSVSSLSEDHLDFLESMLREIKDASSQFEEAIRNDDLPAIKEMATTFQEIFQMVGDSCDSNPPSDQKED